MDAEELVASIETKSSHGFMVVKKLLRCCRASVKAVSMFSSSTKIEFSSAIPLIIPKVFIVVLISANFVLKQTICW